MVVRPSVRRDGSSPEASRPRRKKLCFFAKLKSVCTQGLHFSVFSFRSARRSSVPFTPTHTDVITARQSAIEPHELAMNRRHDCFAGKPAEVHVHNFKALTIKNGAILWLISSLLYGAMLPDQDMLESLW